MQIYVPYTPILTILLDCFRTCRTKSLPSTYLGDFCLQITCVLKQTNPFKTPHVTVGTPSSKGSSQKERVQKILHFAEAQQLYILSLMLRWVGLKGVKSLQWCPPPLGALFMNLLIKPL